MDVAKKQSPVYALGAPWMFRGSALYQLHLVKAETARAFVPKGLKLVEAFGYTLGGFFLAHYDDSPAGMFDELVVIAGIVWDPPTSCGWAAKVLVNSHEACKHGQKEVGLPSHVGVFSKRRLAEVSKKPTNELGGLLGMIGMDFDYPDRKEQTEIQISEMKGSSLMSICNISLPSAVPNSERVKEWMGPRIRMQLPSFSGQTTHNPHLLKYSCQIDCRVRAVEAAKVRIPATSDMDERSNHLNSNDEKANASIPVEDDSWNQSISVLLSKPILALEFNLLKMQVDMPSIVEPQDKRGQRSSN